LAFWLDRGVIGFRIDATRHLFESETFLDEPCLMSEYECTINFDSLDHIYTTNQPETIEIVKEWREFVDNYLKNKNIPFSRYIIFGERNFKSSNLYFIFRDSQYCNNYFLYLNSYIGTESYSPIDVLMQYYGNSTKPGANVPFNLGLVRNVDKRNIIESIDTIVKNWLDNMPENQAANWAVSILKYKTFKKILNVMFKSTIQYYFNTFTRLKLLFKLQIHIIVYHTFFLRWKIMTTQEHRPNLVLKWCHSLQL